jgi:heat shock protein HslJ
VPPTPAPTLAPTPVPQVSFWADRTSINQGECTTLRWSVENVQAVWVYPQGQDFNQFPRTGQGSEVVCPASTTTYEMRVLLRDGSTVVRQVTIAVATPAPTATPVPPPPTPDPLANTRWDVVNLNTGQAIESLLPDTAATLDFGGDGRLGGSSGCNTYQGPYRTSENTIAIGPLSATSQFCTEPAGVMEQETQLLAALQSAATFRITGNQLEMQNAAGQIAVVANRAP